MLPFNDLGPIAHSVIRLKKKFGKGLLYENMFSIVLSLEKNENEKNFCFKHMRVLGNKKNRIYEKGA